jgi:hypothetical protein
LLRSPTYFAPPFAGPQVPPGAMPPEGVAAGEGAAVLVGGAAGDVAGDGAAVLVGAAELCTTAGPTKQKWLVCMQHARVNRSPMQG